MKGVVFTEFLEMVENQFSADIADRIVDLSDLPSGGTYTSVGTYDHQEMLQLVTHLSNETGVAVPDLVRAFGGYLFTRFVAGFPAFFEGPKDAIEFLTHVEDYIHVEVRKLYPDAELPSFHCESPEPGRLEMTYKSTRPFAGLAEGLILACVEHYGEPINLAVEDLSNGAGTSARFTLTRTEAAA